jgi:hypothetical protein
MSVVGYITDKLSFPFRKPVVFGQLGQDMVGLLLARYCFRLWYPAQESFAVSANLFGMMRAASFRHDYPAGVRAFPEECSLLGGHAANTPADAPCFASQSDAVAPKEHTKHPLEYWMP